MAALTPPPRGRVRRLPFPPGGRSLRAPAGCFRRAAGWALLTAGCSRRALAASALRAAGCVLLALAGCSLLPGLLHIEPVSVTAHQPDREFLGAGEVTKASVTFSNAMSRPATEAAFSLQESGGALAGRFAWANGDRTLIFTPLAPLVSPGTFTLSVTTQAEDTRGNSLEQDFSFTFRTALERERPAILLPISPEDGAVIADPRQEVHLRFSEAMDPASVYAGFSLFPELRGALSMPAGGSELLFSPLEDYEPGRLYTVRLAESACDLSGNTLAEGLVSHFSLAAAADLHVETVLALSTGAPLEPASAGVFLNSSVNIEKDEELRVTFSREVPWTDRAALFRLDPFAALAGRWEPDGRSCLVSFGQPLLWQQVYQLEALGETYRFQVNGVRSVPLSVESVGYCADLLAADPPGPLFVPLEFAGDADFRDPDLSPDADPDAPVLDIHFRHAATAVIDHASFLEAFSVSVGNGCIGIELLDVEFSPLTIPPDPPAGVGQSVVRVFCLLTDDPAALGTVRFELAGELHDQWDNRLSEPYSLVVNNLPLW